jgi:Protein of unknown function (DUF2934)
MAMDILWRIRERAYQLWEQEGRPEGRHLDHWLQAEHELVAANAMDFEFKRHRQRDNCRAGDDRTGEPFRRFAINKSNNPYAAEVL